MVMEKALEVLVIGGNRYVGKRLIARLLADGHRVTVLNRGWSPTGTTSGP
jgi:nucleoside-diphosphate-sugar epimerase